MAAGRLADEQGVELAGSERAEHGEDVAGEGKQPPAEAPPPPGESEADAG